MPIRRKGFNMLVKLLKEKGMYKDKKTNEEKNYTNFYLECGDKRIAVEPKYFGTDDKPDKGYSGRKQVLEAFADTLPVKVDSNFSNTSNVSATAAQ